MSYNRFHKPMERYVPIPFEQLMVVGKELNAQRRLAEEDLHNYVKSASEFTSLLEKDVESYYKTAMNDNIKRVVNEAAQNPEVMKSSAWRAGLANAINSVNYGLLAKYKASAEQAKVYNAAAKQLAMQGKLPPGWEPDYFSNYSTDTSGIFNESPLPYESMADRIKPYVDNLKDSYLGYDNGYDLYGVDASTIARQLNVYKSDILNNPSNIRDIQRYMKKGMTLKEATEHVINQAHTAGLEFMRVNRIINPVYEIDKKALAAARRTSGIPGQNGTFLFTQSMALNARSKASEAAVDYFRALYEDKYNAIKDGSSPSATEEQKIAAQQAIKELQEFRKNTSDETIRKAMYKEGATDGGTFESGKPVETNAAVAAGNKFLNVYGDQSAMGGEYNEVLTDNIQGVSNKKENGNRIVTGPTNLSLLPITVAGIVGEKVDKFSPLVKIDNAIKSGKFKLEIVGAGGMMNFPSGDDSSVNYGYVNVTIPEKALLDSNLVNIWGATSEFDFAVEKFREEEERDPQPHEIPLEVRKRALEFVLQNIAQKTTDYPEQNQSITNVEKGESESTSTTSSRRQQPPVYTFIMTYPLAGHHGGIAAENLNASIAKKRKSTSQTGDEQVVNFIMSHMQ